MVEADQSLFADAPAGGYAPKAGAEPLPGYRLLAPLGRGGYGEVWKCEVPGGLHKAIKFVDGNLKGSEGSAVAARQEFQALQRVKDIRHPFVLSMERVEVSGGQLMIVMELADKSLADVLEEYRSNGLPGIPRDQVLLFLLEAAEALDLMNFQFGLQHLDIKPKNLFYVSNHIKVADFGLVSSLVEAGAADGSRPVAGVTPMYASPEILQGRVSRHSDQYSLAIVYQELLTGTLPFTSKVLYKLIMQHLTGEPNLEALPEADRPLIARALSKDPEQRFGSCFELLQALYFGREQKPEKAAPAAMQAASLRMGMRAAPPKAGHVETGHEMGAETALLSPSSTGDALPGHRFIDFQGANPLYEAWKVAAADGRERLAVCLSLSLAVDPHLVKKLRSLSHPALPRAEIYRSLSGRIFIVTDVFAQTLRDRFRECFNQGMPGIPRAELLDYLRTAAQALDELAEKFQLRHLAINPRSLPLGEGGVLLADFGLVELLWRPTNPPAAPLNPRYAAPELTTAVCSDRADQYSLALVYAEMLSGCHPRQGRNRAGPLRAPTRLDLDLLPATDRAVLLRALSPDPAERFASCTEFVRALEEVSVRPGEPEKPPPPAWPHLVSLAHLLGHTGPVGETMPSLEQFLLDLIATACGAVKVLEYHNFRYLRHADNVLECKCLLRMYAGGLKLKLGGFREQWKGKVLREDDANYVCRLYSSPSLWQSLFGQQPGFEVNVRIEAVANQEATTHQAIIRVQPFGSSAEPFLESLEVVGPRLIESAREFLHAAPESRAEERWPYDQPIQVFPLTADGQVGEPLPGMGQDLSLGGIGFTMAQSPPSALAYLQLAHTPPWSAYGVLAELAHGEVGGDGRIQVSAVFSPEPA